MEGQMKIFILLVALLLPAILNAQTTPTQTVKFNLAWIDNSGKDPKVNDQEDGFIIERSPTQTGTFKEVGRVAQNVVVFADIILNDLGNTQQCYQVRSFNKLGVSNPSNIACATSPAVIIVPPTPG